MSNNNRRGAPYNHPQRQQRFPDRQRSEREPQPEVPQQAQYYPQPYPYQQRSYKDQGQMGRMPPYNPQMHYNNYYYQQYPQYPHYPSPYPLFYPHPQYAPYPHAQNASQHKELSVSSPEKKNYPRREDDRRQQDERRQEERPNREERPVREERKPQEERRPYQEERRSYQQQKYEPRQQRQSYNSRPRRPQPKQDRDSQQSNEVGFTSESDSESQEVIYRRKAIAKKKDPVLDSKEEIRKWLQARKRNYPKRSMGEEQTQARAEAGELSILEKKIRKKILLINADTKSMMKKQKDIDILRRFILYSRRNKRPVPPQRTSSQPLVRDTAGEEEVARGQQPVKEMQKEEVVEPIEPAEPVEPAEHNEAVQAAEPVEEPEQGAVVQLPIKSERRALMQHSQYQRRQQLSVEVIVKHLQMKQAQDAKTLSSLLDYKSNSFHFRYQHQTLETNLLLDNIFSETSYILQAIRYIVNNRFFDQPPQ